MRVIKPFGVSLTQRLFVWKKEARLSVALLHYFPFEAPQVPLPEIPLWQGLMEAMGDTIPDEGLPKTRGEALLAGKAYAPGGVKLPAFAVTLKVARDEKALINKQVAVIGPRQWGTRGPSDPEPISELPLSWEFAFGGEEYLLNPKGIGMPPAKNGETPHLMPQLENPKALIRSPRDRPQPTSFGPLDPTLDARMRMMGTYDSAWLSSDFPGFARDMSDEFFQVAQHDQRIDGYWQGGETIEIHHAHAEHRIVKTQVPTLRARCFVRQLDDDQEEVFREVNTRPETLILLPNTRRGIVIHRGVLDVREDDGADVTLLLAALEHMDRPKPTSHYKQAIAQRLDPEKGHLYIVKQQDLLPERDPDTPRFGDESFGDMEAIVEREGAVEKRARTRAETMLAQGRLQAEILGIDPDEYFPKQIAPPGEKPELEELSDYMEKLDQQVEDERLRAEKLKLLAEQQQRHVADIMGLDYDQMIADGQQQGAGPPSWNAAGEIQKLRDLVEMGRNGGHPFVDLEEKLKDPELLEKFQTMEQQMLFTYRKFAHHYPDVKAADETRNIQLRARVQAALDTETSLAQVDLTGADLRGLSLAGADLSEALLEGANLAGVDLTKATLKGTVLVRANLEGSQLVEADLRGANLGKASLRQANLRGANLSEAVLHQCVFNGADLNNANLHKADLLEADFFGAVLHALQAPEAMFYEMNFSDADFSGANLHKALFCKCKLGGAIFTDSMLEEACFADSHAQGANFDSAQLSKAKCVGDTSFEKANFTAAVMHTTNFRDVVLRDANFHEAIIEASDFSGADAQRACFTKVKGQGASFVRTDLSSADLSDADLREALLLKAVVPGTNFERANLFRANLLQARGDDATSFRGALVKRALFRDGDV